MDHFGDFNPHFVVLTGGKNSSGWDFQEDDHLPHTV
jgi:hypothetical protein